MLNTTLHKTQDEDKLNKKHSIICVGHHLTQDTRPRQAKYKNTAHYVLDTTIHKTQDEDKLNKKHSTICVGQNLTQDEDKLNKKHSTICAGHHLTQDTRRRQTKQKTQHNMYWTSLYANKHKKHK